MMTTSPLEYFLPFLAVFALYRLAQVPLRGWVKDAFSAKITREEMPAAFWINVTFWAMLLATSAAAAFYVWNLRG